MRKFFELAVVSRKSVKGETVLTAEAKSKAGESLGTATVVVQKEGKKGGVYFRYVPTEEADVKESIHVVELKAEDQAMVTEVLKQLKEQVVENMTKDSETSAFEKFMISSLIGTYINVEEGTLKVPEEFGVSITNEMVSQYWNTIVEDEWIGIEVKFEEKIAEEIGKLAEEKCRKEQKEMEEVESELEALTKSLDDLLKQLSIKVTIS